MTANGMLCVHVCPVSLRAAVDAAIAAGAAHHQIFWSTAEGVLTATGEWAGRPGSAAAVADGLRKLGAVTFEATEDAGAGRDGERFSFVPGLGLFRAGTNSVGDIVVDENQLTAALRDAPNAEALRERLDRLIGGPWDRALEPLRIRAWQPARAAAAG